MISSPYIDEFLAGMQTSGKALYNRTVGLIRQMDTNDAGGLIRSQKNNNIINEVAGIYEAFLDSATYEGRIRTLIQAMPKIGIEISQQWMEEYGEIDPPVLERAIKLTEQYTYALEGALTDDAVEFEIFTPAINELFYAIGSGKEPAADYMDIYSLFESYFGQKVANVMEQYERRINTLYGESFEVKRWIYDGPDDDRTRDFCSARVGKIYNDRQIDSWADEDWNGKIPGTSASNIRLVCGGYNCRHQLIPA